MQEGQKSHQNRYFHSQKIARVLAMAEVVFIKFLTIYYDHVTFILGVFMKVPAGQFKAKCLQIMDELQKTHEEVTVTKHGKPVAKLVPCPSEETARRPIFGFMKGSVMIHGNIVESLGDPWNAEA